MHGDDVELQRPEEQFAADSDEEGDDGVGFTYHNVQSAQRRKQMNYVFGVLGVVCSALLVCVVVSGVVYSVYEGEHDTGSSSHSATTTVLIDTKSSTSFVIDVSSSTEEEVSEEDDVAEQDPDCIMLCEALVADVLTVHDNIRGASAPTIALQTLHRNRLPAVMTGLNGDTGVPFFELAVDEEVVSPHHTRVHFEWADVPCPVHSTNAGVWLDPAAEVEDTFIIVAEGKDGIDIFRWRAHVAASGQTGDAEPISALAGHSLAGSVGVAAVGSVRDGHIYALVRRDYEAGVRLAVWRATWEEWDVSEPLNSRAIDDALSLAVYPHQVEGGDDVPVHIMSWAEAGGEWYLGWQNSLDGMEPELIDRGTEIDIHSPFIGISRADSVRPEGRPHVLIRNDAQLRYYWRLAENVWARVILKSAPEDERTCADMSGASDGDVCEYSYTRYHPIAVHAAPREAAISECVYDGNCTEVYVVYVREDKCGARTAACDNDACSITEDPDPSCKAELWRATVIAPHTVPLIDGDVDGDDEGAYVVGGTTVVTTLEVDVRHDHFLYRYEDGWTPYTTPPVSLWEYYLNLKDDGDQYNGGTEGRELDSRLHIAFANLGVGGVQTHYLLIN